MKPHRFVLAASSLLATISALACSGVPGSGAPSASSTVPPSSPVLAGDWSCVFRHPVGVTPAIRAKSARPRPANDTFTVHLHEAYSNADVGGAQVTACNAFDASCVSPLDGAVADDSGLATLTVPGGLPAFSGYLLVSGTRMPENYVFFAGRVLAEDTNPVDVVVYTGTALGITGSLADGALDPELGLVRVDVVDCAHAVAAGVGVAIDPRSPQPRSRIEYFVGDGVALSSAARTTDGSGVALVFGVSPGAIGLTGDLEGSSFDGTLGFARAGAVTSVVLRPADGVPVAAASAATSCCSASGGVTCCSDLQGGDLMLFNVPGNGVVPVGCWAGGSSGLGCIAGATCAVRRDGQVETGTCGE